MRACCAVLLNQMLLSLMWLSLMLLSVTAWSAHADEVAIYRCTDATGAVTVQNMPCPKGMKQDKKLMQAISTVPMGTSKTPAATHHAASPAGASSATSTAAQATKPTDDASTLSPAEASDLAHLPPPNLFRCTTRDSGSYVIESDEPQERCLPLRSVGLDGSPQGAGNACEVVRDTCARIPDEGLCEAWKKRHDEAEVAWRFTRPETEAKNRAEFERVQRILAESNCAVR